MSRRLCIRLMMVPFFAVSFLGYLTVDHEHPPGHTDEGAMDCHCPGDWTPHPGSLPSLKIVKSFSAIFFVMPALPLWNDDSPCTLATDRPDTVPRALRRPRRSPPLLI